jgi:hypothetical protein
MILTKTTIIEWASSEDANNMEIEIERSVKIAQMIEEEKTDGNVYFAGLATYSRDWVSQEAAQEFVDFIDNLANRLNKTIISHTIVDK